MDRDGLVIAALDELLPPGRVLDVGAGDGFTAERLGAGRPVVALDPSAGMLARADLRHRVRGEAEHLPFAEAAFDGAYATWAYFFSRDWDPTPGIAELDRVVRPGGRSRSSTTSVATRSPRWPRPTSAPTLRLAGAGVRVRVIETAFRFEDLEEAQRLLGFFFGGARRCRCRARGPVPGRAVPSIQPRSLTDLAMPGIIAGTCQQPERYPTTDRGPRVPAVHRRVVRPPGPSRLPVADASVEGTFDEKDRSDRLRHLLRGRWVPVPRDIDRLLGVRRVHTRARSLSARVAGDRRGGHVSAVRDPDRGGGRHGQPPPLGGDRA